MPNWETKFISHEIHKNIPLVENVIDAALGANPANDEKEDLLKIKKVIEFLKAKLAGIDPLLIPAANLNNINSNLRDMLPNLNSYAANKTINHLVMACNIVETVLPYVSTLPSINTVKELDGVGDSIAGFYKSVTEYKTVVGESLSKFSEQAKLLDASMKLAGNEINLQKSRLDSAIAEYQKQFSTAEGERRRLNSESESKREAVYTEKVKILDQGLTTSLESQKRQFNEFIEAIKVKFNSHEEKIKKDISSILGIMEQNKKQAENLITVITNTGMVGGYQKIANRAEHITWWWYAIAVGSLLGLVGFAVSAYSHTSETVIVIPKMLAKVFVAVTFGLLAAYAAREADKHGQIERRNRKMELELASIDPYLVNFDKPKREQIKEAIANKVFGQDVSLDIKHPDKFSGNTTDTLKLALTMVHEALQKIK